MKLLGKILLIGCVINCLIFDVLFFDKQFAISNATDILELVVIIVNFLFVIWVYFRDDKKADKEKEEEKRRFWYHDIIIQHNLMNVQDLYGECLNVGAELVSNKDFESIKKLIRKIKDKKKFVDNTLGYMLMAYEEELYDRFNGKLIEFEDHITDLCRRLAFDEIDLDNYTQEVKKLEVDLIDILMKHDLCE